MLSACIRTTLSCCDFTTMAVCPQLPLAAHPVAAPAKFGGTVNTVPTVADLQPLAERRQVVAGRQQRIHSLFLPCPALCTSKVRSVFSIKDLPLTVLTDLWRKAPSPSNLEMSKFDDKVSQGEYLCYTSLNLCFFKDSAWFLLLMADDEFSRAESSHFRLLHPKPATVLRYLSMYRSHRFSGTSVGPFPAPPLLAQYLKQTICWRDGSSISIPTSGLPTVAFRLG
jgi:hypothetical protein